MTQNGKSGLENFEGEVRAFLQKFEANNNFCKLTEDSAHVDMIVEGFVHNLKTHGKRYCPCRLVTGDPEEDRKKICPCRWLKEELERNGACHCGLFVPL
ncbi:ferredoxin-thioredoxin reductase catalytic domain-containing protein [Candidatus Hydrogenedentota bacterium]